MSVIKTVGVVVFKGNNVLLVRHKAGAKHKTGVYGLPAGKIEKEEPAKAAAIRELKEETGFVALPRDVAKLPKIYYASIEQKDGVKRFSYEVYICKKYTGSLKESEETKPKWVAIGELNSKTTIANVKEAIHQALILTTK